MTNYTIFGAGPGGLYTAWRLAMNAGPNDGIWLYEWGNYDFDGASGATRAPAGRICSHHYKGDPNQSYVELGGMRYIEWDGTQGHFLVTTTINKLPGLASFRTPFNTTANPLFYLRRQNFYQQQLGQGVKAPYNTPDNDKPADALFNQVSKAITGTQSVKTRTAQCEFYATGTLPEHLKSFVYRKGDLAGNVGYWNFFYDQANNEGYEYASDANGYTSNVIGWNAANAAIYNGEFAPGGNYMTLSGGYSMLFARLYSQIKALEQTRGFKLHFHPKTRLHSIWINQKSRTINYRYATAEKPFSATGDEQGTQNAFLCLPPRSLELVACATRYADMKGKADILNDANVQNVLQSVILQPSYKIAMFFDSEWWKNAKYPPQLGNNIFGPTITDLSLRQVYYFGNNAPRRSGPPVYGLLASYDDMQYTTFWQDMELSATQRRNWPLSWDYQPLVGPRDGSPEMERMLLQELAAIHYGSRDEVDKIPKPKQTSYINWGLDPFGAGYHAWAAHFNIGHVMQHIRKPAPGANFFIIGSAFSNDQAWVEGAFCTAESVLIDYLDLPPLTTIPSSYPLICKSSAPDSVAAHAGVV